jgi:hypothetical protein
MENMFIVNNYFPKKHEQENWEYGNPSYLDSILLNKMHSKQIRGNCYNTVNEIP